MKKEMLINVLQPEECRIAIIEDGVLEELYVERTSHETYTGNIYKGRIVNLEPAIQAAFVDFSIGRNGFLHVSDIEPRYYRRQLGDEVELGGRDRGRDPRRTPRPDGAAPGRSDFGRSEPRSGGRSPRDNRRSSPPVATSYTDYPPQSYSTGGNQTRYEQPSGFGGGLADSDFGEFVAIPPDMPPSSPSSGRGDSRRDRPRRGQGRDRNRPTRSRDQSFRGGGSRQYAPAQPPHHPEVPTFDENEYAADFEVDTPTNLDTSLPINQAPEFSPELNEIRPEPRLEEPVVPTPAQEHIVQEAVYEQPAVIPPPLPSRPQRGFGAGLEDWDNEPLPPAHSPFLTPVQPAIPIRSESFEFGTSTKPIVDPQPKVEKPEPPRPETQTITRSIAPAPTKSPVRSRFGSGLLDETEPVEEPTPAYPEIIQPDLTEIEAQTVAIKEVTEEPQSITNVQTPPRWDEPPFDVDEPQDVDLPTLEAVQIDPTVPASPVSDALELAPESDLFAAETEITEQSAPRSRGRRKSGPDRGRSRNRRNSQELSQAEAQVSDPELTVSDSETVGEGVELEQARSPQIVEVPEIHPGRNAIRARSGDRKPIGPRLPVTEDFLKAEQPQAISPAPKSREKGRSGNTSGRYVPRLERERRRSNSEAGLNESGLVSDPEFASSMSESDFDLQDGMGESVSHGAEFEAVNEEDPRLAQRGQQSKNRRRRRRRRPGTRENQDVTSEVQSLDNQSSSGAERDLPDLDTQGSDWSELDWSGSPPGAAEALSDLAPATDSDFDQESPPSGPRGQRQRRGYKRHRRNRTWPEIGPAPGEDISDEIEDDLSDSSGESYTPDPNDIVEPELEEEIRREADEIEALEIELGIRQPGEFRDSPRSGAVQGGRSATGRGPFKPPIQDVFQRNDEVLVQVIKESLGTKGPTLSTYISIPGRYLVLMPGLNRVGVSRKIGDEFQRRKLRDQMNQLNPPKGLGFIVRTAGVDRTKRELARDLAYLLRLWKTILRRIKRTKSPAPIYQESDMIIRTIRDIFNAEIDTIWIDEPSSFERAQEFLRNVMPKFVDRLKLYGEKVPLFHKYGIEDEIAKIGQRHVPLPDGGSIVIDQTEALVAIDVNSGSFRADDDAERNAYEMNLRAAREIARQLRLRDLGGVIVNDFIDMRDERHRRGVERALRDAIRRDRARTKILRMSQFGLIEMTRQRIRPSIKRSIYEDCPNCLAQGVVKTPESMSIDVMRILALAVNRQDIRRINITCSQNVANFMNNRKRQDLARLERDGHLTIHIRPEPEAPAEFLQIDGFGNYNTEVRLYPTQAMLSHRRMPNTTGNAPALPYGHTPSHGGGSHGYNR